MTDVPQMPALSIEDALYALNKGSWITNGRYTWTNDVNDSDFGFYLAEGEYPASIRSCRAYDSYSLKSTQKRCDGDPWRLADFPAYDSKLNYSDGERRHVLKSTAKEVTAYEADDGTLHAKPMAATIRNSEVAIYKLMQDNPILGIAEGSRADFQCLEDWLSDENNEEVLLNYLTMRKSVKQQVESGDIG